jgi:hypothetical protein
MSRNYTLVAVGVLLAIGLRLALPLAGPHASESDPYHTHIVLGAASLGEVERALALHVHGSPAAGDASGNPAQPMEAAGGVHVLSLGASMDGRVIPLGSGVLGWLLLGVLPWLVLPGSQFQARVRQIFFLQGRAPLPLTPPPRFSF